jgi:CHC2-type zinc finger protein
MTDHAREIRAALTDAKALVTALGLTKNARRNARGVMILCPNHGENTPSCSVRLEGDGTIGVNCFGCGFAGDALRLIAKVYNLNERTEFKQVLLAACDIAGLSEIADEINGNKPRENRPLPAPPQFIPERSYPPASELVRFWTECGSVKDEPASKRVLVERGLDPDEVDRYGLAKAITPNQWLPGWATYQSNTWRFTGHRIVMPVYGSDGVMKSVRAWKVEGDAPAKRLPPSGYKANGLAMANNRAVAMLTQKKGPCRVLITEGEPDFLTASAKWFWLPVIGLVSGSWGPEFASKVPLGSEVVIMTHHDTAGDKYADLVTSTLKNRAVVLRSAL